VSTPNGTRLLILGANVALSQTLCEALRGGSPLSVERQGAFEGDFEYSIDPGSVDVAVFVPAIEEGLSAPDLTDAQSVFETCLRAGVRHVVIVSSSAVYAPSSKNPGFISEARPLVRDGSNSVSAAWLKLEALAQKTFMAEARVKLTILRAAPVLLPGGRDFFSRLFSHKLTVTLAGHDPSLQLLSPGDLAAAIAQAADRSPGGVFNIAPDGVVPLKAALQMARAPQMPLMPGLPSLARAALKPLGNGESVDRFDYIRFSFTVSNLKAKQELGFTPLRNSSSALCEFLERPEAEAAITAKGSFDAFGMDKEYIARTGKRFFDFLFRHYWRIEVEGLEYVPKTGRGILLGLHRGLIAWDGIMVFHLLVQRLSRYPRFLVHPAGFRFPFLFDVTTKLGGIPACQENADFVLENDELLGIFPEGIRGVFSLYKEAYQLRKFGRSDFVKMALRHRAPIIPFVIVGSAEAYPILGKLDWSWWKRTTEWPFFPITPTLFPLIPLPLPSKWRIRFLPALLPHLDYPPEAARNATVVRAISDRVRNAMGEAVREMTSQRRSMFFG
jgi:1-acyl-sn-glycerol-3-phosphate acyltransferase/nucleoside-diphosphate-sugar epimerase